LFPDIGDAGHMNRYQKQKEASRQAILQAALTLFRDEG
jgi:hypothetical protein